MTPTRLTVDRLEDRLTPVGGVVANFGDAVWRWTTTTGWQQLAAFAAQELDLADDGSVYAVAAGGTYRWAAGVPTGQLTTAAAAQQVELTAAGIAFADFGGDGLYRSADTPGGWQRISTQDATMIDASDDGSVFGYFPNGLWRWRVDLGWVFLTGNAPTSIRAADDGVLYGVFGNGVWRWQDGTWTGLTGAVPQNYAVSDGGLFYGDFGSGSGHGPTGLWQWSPATGAWDGLTGADPIRLSVSPAGTVFADFDDQGGTFAPRGLWRWDVTTRTWSQPGRNVFIVAGGAGSDESYFADFGPGDQGVSRYVHGAGWTKLTPAVPTLLTTRR